MHITKKFLAILTTSIKDKFIIVFAFERIEQLEFEFGNLE